MSAQLLPNYQLVKHLTVPFEGTVQVLCVFTEGTREQAQWFRQTVERHLGLAVRTDDGLFLERADYAAPAQALIAGLLNDRPRDEWVISCVGGTKMMAAGAVLAIADAIAAGVKVRAQYVDFDDAGQCVDVFSGAREALTAELTVPEYLDLYGIAVPTEAQRSGGQQRWESLCMDWAATDPRVLPLALPGNPVQRQEALNHWRRYGLDSAAQIPWNSSLRPELRQLAMGLLVGQTVPNWVMRLLTGDLLDTLIYRALTDYAPQLGISEVRRWVRSEAFGEVDLCVVRGGELVLIECKAGRQAHQEVLSQIAKLDLRRQRIGAKKSRGMLVSSGENLFTDATDNAWNYAVLEAAARGTVQVIGRPQIMRLAEGMRAGRHQDAIVQLKDWFDGHLPTLD